MASTVTKRVQIGAEGSGAPGVIVAATKRLPDTTFTMGPVYETKEIRAQGSKYQNKRVPGKRSTRWTGAGQAGYGSMAYWLTGLLTQAAPVPVGTGGYQWAPAHTPYNPDTPQTYSMEFGDNSGGYNFGFGLVTGMTLTGNRDEVKVATEGIGQLWTPGFTLTSTNGVQQVAITGAPTGGTFTLTIMGQTIPNLAYNITAVAMAAAINAVLGTGAVGATGGPLPTTPIVVTFGGVLAGQAVPVATANSAALTGGTTPAVVVTQTTAGAPGFVENVPIDPNTVSLYLDTTPGAIGTTLLPDDVSWELALTGRWGPDWTVNAANASYGGYVELVPTATLRLELRNGSVSDAFITQLTNAAVKYLQIRAVGAAIGTANYGLTINVPFAVESGGEPKDVAGVWCVDWNAVPVADPALLYALQYSVTNKVATL